MGKFRNIIARLSATLRSDQGVAIQGKDGKGKYGGRGGRAIATGKGSRAVGGKGGDSN